MAHSLGVDAVVAEGLSGPATVPGRMELVGNDPPR